jgi:adenosylcobinamide-GDP ribazoletransferase
MRDSRIGAFGACALILAFALRVGAVATLADRLDPWGAAAALIGAASLSRAGALIVLARLPPARADGASFSVGRPTPATLGLACGLGLALTLGLGLAASLPVLGLLMMTALPLLAVGALMRAARRLIGGQTGDVVGAAQQIAEVAALLGLLIALAP